MPATEVGQVANDAHAVIQRNKSDSAQEQAVADEGIQGRKDNAEKVDEADMFFKIVMPELEDNTEQHQFGRATAPVPATKTSSAWDQLVETCKQNA